MRKFFMIWLVLLLLSVMIFSSCSQNTVENTVPRQTEDEPTAEEQAYTQAKNYLNEGKYQEAYDLFLTIQGYKDVDEHLGRFFYQCGKEETSGKIILHEYDVRGNQVKYTLIEGDSTYEVQHKYEYSEKGYIVKSDSTLLEYDEEGYVTKITDGDEIWLIEYNREKKPTKTTIFVADECVFEMLWEYDTDERIIKETEKEYENSEVDELNISVYTYECDDQGRVTRYTETYQSGSSKTTVYEYDSKNNIIKETTSWIGFTPKMAHTKILEYQYDTEGNMIHKKKTYIFDQTDSSQETDITIFEYQYDEKGNMTQKKETDKDGIITVTTYSDYKLYYHWNPAFETNEWINERI